MDLEVSSTSSGETLEPGASPEGLDIIWAEAPQTWHLARWCVARVHGVCRAMAKILAASDFQRNKECLKYAGKLHLSVRDRGKGRRRFSVAQIRENSTSKAQGPGSSARVRRIYGRRGGANAERLGFVRRAQSPGALPARAHGARPDNQ